MANDISSMIMAQAPRPADQSGQFAKSEAVKVVQKSGSQLPEKGQNLPSAEAKSATSSSQIREAVGQVNNFVQSVQRDLSFKVDEDSGRTIIKVMDSGSGKLIRQIPSEEVLALASYLKDVNSEGASASIPQGILFSDNT